MPTRLTQLAIRRVSVVPKGANQEAQLVLFKSEDGMADKTIEQQVATLTEQVANLTKAKNEADEALRKAEEEKQQAITKAVEEKKTAEEKAKDREAAFVALQKSAEETKTALLKISEEREIERFTTIQKEVPHLGDVAAIRTIAKAMGPQGFGEYLAKQRAFAKQLAESELFATLGKDGGSEGGGDFNAEVQRIAKSLQQADAKLTPEQAYVKALEQMSPEQYEAQRQTSYVNRRH